VALFLAASLLRAQAVAEACRAVTQEGVRCSRDAKDPSGYCTQHAKIAAAATHTDEGKEDDFPEVNMQFITEPRRVLAVTNGVYLVLDGAQKARLSGVVANNRANDFVRAFCGTNEVVVEYERVETGHRYATVYVRNAAGCLNEELIRAGLGGVDIRSRFRYWEPYIRAENQARTARRGLWAGEP